MGRTFGASKPRAGIPHCVRARRSLRPALHRASVALLLVAVAPIAGAENPAAPAGCSEAAARAERAWNLPAGLLAAIGRAESGRPDPLTGRVEPWPFAINVAGAGYFFPSTEAAVAHVRALQGGGVQSIDVGCFQVNLLYHPAAFGSLGAAFDATANAAAAAQFLAELYQRSGNWAAAVALYHSALPERGEPYRARVFATWRGGDAPLPSALPRAGNPEPPQRDPHVVLLAASAYRVTVITPGDGGGHAASDGRQSGRLPRVFVPR